MLNPDEIIIRPFKSQEEALKYCILSSKLMVKDQDPGSAGTNWDRFTREYPGFRWEQRRGAFYQDRLLGGLMISEGLLYAGKAHLKTGCIGSVATDPLYQRQGVATKLMQDALDYAKEREYPLLLLNGIPGFYSRLGYTTITDYWEFEIGRSFLEALKPGPYYVRQANLSDAQLLLDLYKKHFATFTGAFYRTLEKQIHFLKFRLPQELTLLAFDMHDQPRGYVTFRSKQDTFYAVEVAADDWDACVALLQEQSALLTRQHNQINYVQWVLPPGSITYHLLNDYRTDRDFGGNWMTHTHIYNRPGSGWMARLASVKDFVKAMIPQWQSQIRGLVFPEIPGMTLVIDNVHCSMSINAGSLAWCDDIQGFPEVILTGEVMMQLLFGYRSVDWALHQPGQFIPPALKPILEMFFLHNRGWIAHSDNF